MQYDAIILELMSRIQSLETSYNELKERISTLEEARTFPSADAESASLPESPAPEGRQKMTSAMIEACYRRSVELAQNPQGDPQRQALLLSQECGMNRGSAAVYLYVIGCMLSGTVYKRAISQTATAVYFQNILRDFGPDRLAKAVAAARGHIAYRQSLGHVVDGLIQVCDRYEARQ